MAWLISASDFLVSQWIWNVTWGWYHIPVNIFVMLFLLKFFGRMRIIPAVLSSFFSQVFSFFCLSALALVIPNSLTGVPQGYYEQQLMHPLFICLSLGVVYFVLNSLFFMLLNFIYKINLRLIILILFVGNILSAFLVYKFWSYNFL